MVFQDIFNFEFKRSKRVKNMSSEIKLDLKEDVRIDPALFFQRLLVVAQSNPVDMQEIMTYELSACPLSLFESPTLLRKADKPKLMDVIVHQVKSDHTDELLYNTKDNTDEHILDDPENPTPVNEISTTDQYVLDGGSLLHRVRSTKHSTYTEIANSCANFVNANYAKAIVVFDVYESGLSTKDMIHSRRTTKFVSRTINFSTGTKFVGLKERFLANTSNKERMVQVIGDTLQKSGCQVFYENGDADVKIAKTAVEESLTKNVTLIGEDTDLLVLLLYHCVEESDFILYFRSDKENKKEDNIIHDIYHYRTVLATQLCSDLLFIHAFSGCDTTSSFCGIGKGTLFSMHRNQNNKVLQRACRIFSSNNMSQAEIKTIKYYREHVEYSVAITCHKLKSKQ